MTWSVSPDVPPQTGGGEDFDSPLRGELADPSLGYQGAGLIGYSEIVVYPDDTVGSKLAEFATSVGSGLIGFIQQGTNAVLRTLQSRSRDTIHVPDFTSVQDAVTETLSRSGVLFFPAGVVAVTGSVASFHEIRKTGRGGVTRGSDTFYVQPVYNQSNTLYVDTIAGSDTNDGLTADFAMRTTARVATVLAGYGLPLMGSWTVKFAAGTDTGVVNWPEGLYCFGLNRLVLQGPIVGDPNVPTFIVNGGGTQAYGWNFNSDNKLTLSNIKFQNFTTYGWVAQDNCDITDVNVHVVGVPNGPGKKMQGPGRWRSIGGIVSTCQSGLAAIGNVVFTFSSVKAHNNTQAGIALQEGASGHVDNSTFDSNPVHVDAIIRSRAHILGSVFTNAITAHCRGSVLCDIYDNPSLVNSFDLTAPSFLTYTGSVLTATQLSLTSWLDKPVDRAFVTHTGTTSPVVIKTYATALNTNSFEALTKAYRVRINGELTGTAGTKNIVVQLAGSPAFGFTIPAAATGPYIIEGVVNADGQTAQTYDSWCHASVLVPPMSGSRSINMFTAAPIPMTVIVTLDNAGDSLTVRKVQESTRGGC